MYKRISDVAQTLTEGFNAAVKLARHVATKLTLLQDEEGTYYFSVWSAGEAWYVRECKQHRYA